jgi:reactive chlorine resistance protein C
VATLVGDLDSGRAATLIDWTARLEAAGGAVLRYGLVAILLYFGTFKFTAVEAAAIRPLVENSPALGWMYGLLGEQAVSNLIGASEVAIAVLIALRRWSPRAAVVGGLLAAGTFVITLSFLFTTPDSWTAVPGFPLPLPSGGGGFILKDLFLLGAALWSAGEAARAAPRRRAPAHFG